MGNRETVTVSEWVKLCYQAAGKEARLINVDVSHSQRDYFCFYDYAYELNVTKQDALMPDTTLLLEGLKESYLWYENHRELVNKKPYFDYIDKMEESRL